MRTSLGALAGSGSMLASNERTLPTPKYLVIVVDGRRGPQVWASFVMLRDAKAYVDDCANPGAGHVFTIFEE